MSYEPNIWVTGNRITAEKLNHMENGIANAGGGGTTVLRVVSEDGDCKTLDKTWQEVTDLIEAGQRVVYVASYVDVDTNSTTKTAYVLTTSFHNISIEPSQEDWYVYGIAYNVWNSATSEIQLDASSATSPLKACGIG